MEIQHTYRLFAYSWCWWCYIHDMQIDSLLWYVLGCLEISNSWHDLGSQNISREALKIFCKNLYYKVRFCWIKVYKIFCIFGFAWKTERSRCHLSEDLNFIPWPCFFLSDQEKLHAENTNCLHEQLFLADLCFCWIFPDYFQCSRGKRAFGFRHEYHEQRSGVDKWTKHWALLESVQSNGQVWRLQLCRLVQWEKVP